MSTSMDTLLALAEGRSLLHRIWFLSRGDSSQAASTDNLFMFILWVCIISFVLLLIPIVYFPFKYHRSKQATNYVQSPSHHTLLELAWSVVPLMVMIPIFVWGFDGYVSKLASPADAEEIHIRGQMWNWTPRYRNGAETDLSARITDTETDVPVIYVPAERPVKLIMSSSDVIHSFFVPDFRTKMDVFPNRFTSMWFKPMRESTRGPGGKYIDEDEKSPNFRKPYPGSGHWVFCAEYCGTKHAEMGAWIVVLPRREFEIKIHELATIFPEGTWAQAGKTISTRKGCLQCHSIDGSPNSGPTWKNMYGATHTYTDGSSEVVDFNHLREHILYSQRKIMTGYAGQNMPIFAGQIKDTELDAIIFYIKTLSDKTPQPELDKANQEPDFSQPAQ
ncbi:MAG: c-type cytochrome [Phycisphaeraceae bacterium]|nr:c-type cytochrome [Phycisphaeraceae bacterium]